MQEGIVEPENEGTIILQMVRNYSANSAMSHPRKHKSFKYLVNIMNHNTSDLQTLRTATGFTRQ